MPATVVGIDVGTTKICTLIGEVEEGENLRITGVGVAPSRGLRKGVVVNIAEATNAILTSVEKAEHISGQRVESAYVGITGEHIQGTNSRGVISVPQRERGIVQEDIERALEAARAIATPYEQEIIHVIPRFFNVDELKGVRDPLGMQGFRLEVEVHVVTGASASIANLMRCLQTARVTVEELVLEPLASGEAVLTEAEKELGVVLADIGGGTTDVAIFTEGSLCHTAVLPVGGYHLTRDIAVGLRMPLAAAEELKIRHGHAFAQAVSEEEMVEATVFGDEERQTIPRRVLAHIIQARLEEIFGLIMEEIRRSGYEGLLPAGVVLCGGTAQLAGIRDLARQALRLPVRVGVPHDLEGLVDILQNPAYATGVGLLLWGLRRESPSLAEEPLSLWERLTGWLRALLPG